MPDYRTIKTKEDLLAVSRTLDSLPDDHIVELDFEATGLFPKTDYVVGASLSWELNQAVYIPTWCPDHDEFGFTFEEVGELIIRKLKRLRVVSHKWVYDASMAHTNFGVALPCWDDTLVLATLLSMPRGLKDAMVEVFGIPEDEVLDIRELMAHHFGKNWQKSGKNPSHLPITGDKFGIDTYGCKDADFGRQYYFYLKPKIVPNKLVGVHKLDINILPVARRISLTGVPVDPTTMRRATQYVKEHNREIAKQIYALAGSDGVPYEFNINKAEDVANVLFGRLGLPPVLRSQKTGAPSTSKEVLEQLEDMHDIVPLIAEWRQSTRMVTGYLEKIPAQLDENGLVYTDFDPTGAVSGRFTSKSAKDGEGDARGMNLQNISKKRYRFVDENGDERSLSVRASFVAPPGSVWIRADFKQIEPKVGASLAKETALIQAFKEGLDSHTRTTCVCFNMTPEEVRLDTKAGGQKRKLGKIINLALGYGMGVKKLARKLKCSVDEAKVYLQRYWDATPNIAQEVEASKIRLLETNTIRTFFGRLSYIDMGKLRQFDKMEYESALRKSWNRRVQGTAAEFLKIGMLRVNSAIKKYGKDVRFVLTVHDEIDLLAKTEIAQDVMLDVRRAFEVPTPPDWAEFDCDMGYGESWDEVCHTEFTLRDPEPFTSWGNVIPPEYVAHIEPEFLSAA